MIIALFLIGSFFLGAIPNAYWVTKRLKGLDIRQAGSGNVGATNVFRVLGKGPGSLVFMLDFLKGWAPTVIFMTSGFAGSPSEEMGLLIGLAAILGHVFTPFLNFKGGKGVATGSGVLAAVFPSVFFIAVLVWTLTFFISRIVSISSILAAASLPITSLLFHDRERLVWLLAGLFFLVLITHRSNVLKLLSGKESKINRTNI